MDSYEDVELDLREVPKTWLPSLLLVLVRECIKQNVFAGVPELLRVVELAAKEQKSRVRRDSLI